MSKLKVHVVGGSTSYANWLLDNPHGEHGILVNNIKEADIVVFTGGGDVHPSYYGRSKHYRTSASTPDTNIETRDMKEWRIMEEVVELGKPMWGTCRGLQLMCAFAGGDLIQDVDHGYAGHNITFYDGTEVYTNTIHHQMIYPFEKLKEGEDYYIVANALGLSDHHYGETDTNLAMPTNEQGVILEPEAAFFTKINGFGQQSHLEMQSVNKPVVRLTRKLVEYQIKGELEFILQNKISFGDILKPEFSIEKVIKGEFILS